ncbi:MAG TPA: hypothetical protein VL403_02725 [Candidatus Kryptonia bacterium]|nr:hypothetical protein [Candidatus Kryptonia bacterium]
MSHAAAAIATPLSDAQVERYSRQIILREVGATGQQRLLAASAALAGSSAIAVTAARYLAAAGIGRLVVSEPTIAAATESNPDTRIETFHDAGSAVASVSVIIAADAGAELLARLNRVAIGQRVPLVLATTAALASHVTGHITTLAGHRRDAPCAACLTDWAMAAHEPDSQFAELVQSLTGTLAATEALKCALDIGTKLYGRRMCCDVQRGTFETRLLAKDPLCPVCRLEP